MEVLKFIIVGHVDHGKSTLIGRLLYDTASISFNRIEEIKKISKDLGRKTEFAYLIDHLEEERQRRITIDITQVFFKTKKRRYVIIDAPGHVEFVKNMITGGSQAEAAILIVDINEGIKEQTKRHAYILSLLGIKQIIVVLNKMDLVNFAEDKFFETKKNIEVFLDSINIKPLCYIPLSAIMGENIAKKSRNMSWYKGTILLESLDNLQAKSITENRPLLFPVQDIYKVGNKRIVVGRIELGVLRKGQVIKVLPNGQKTKIASVESFLERINVATAGKSIGITTEDDIFINRGDVICSPNHEPTLSDKFCANIFWMSKSDLSKDQWINIRCATQEVICSIKLIKKRIDSSSLEVLQKNANYLKNLEVGEVVIKTKKPIVIERFNDVQELGRFVLIQERDIQAGGIITSVE
jgi:sulfate adenylyltransferase large subunit